MRWFSGLERERLWLESTDRDDIGVNLKFPALDGSGRDNWRYSLFLETRPGDMVVHYHKLAGIVGTSLVSGAPEPKRILWAARGTSARAKGTEPYERDGWVIPLSDYRPLAEPVSLAGLRERTTEIRSLYQALRDDHAKQPLYFPFELSDRRPLRLLQGYAFKLPAAILELFPQIRAIRNEANISEAETEGNSFLIEEFPEGQIAYRRHLVRERNSRLVLEAKRQFKARTGRVSCQACGFDFEAVYGDAGKDFIEAHHDVPVSELEPGGVTRVEDLTLLCSNCHALIHRRRPWMSVAHLRTLLSDQSRNLADKAADSWATDLNDMIEDHLISEHVLRLNHDLRSIFGGLVGHTLVLEEELEAETPSLQDQKDSLRRIRQGISRTHALTQPKVLLPWTYCGIYPKSLRASVNLAVQAHNAFGLQISSEVEERVLRIPSRVVYNILYCLLQGLSTQYSRLDQVSIRITSGGLCGGLAVVQLLAELQGETLNVDDHEEFESIAKHFMEASSVYEGYLQFECTDCHSINSSIRRYG